MRAHLGRPIWANLLFRSRLASPNGFAFRVCPLLNDGSYCVLLIRDCFKRHRETSTSLFSPKLRPRLAHFSFVRNVAGVNWIVVAAARKRHDCPGTHVAIRSNPHRREQPPQERNR